MTLQPGAVRRRRNPRGQGQVLRAELVEAAARLVASSDRPESLTLRQVAREVGVAPASIYGHFPDLGALLDAVLQRHHAALTELLGTAAGSPTPLGRLAARCLTFVRWGTGHPGEYRSLFGGRAPTGIHTPSSHRAGNALIEDMTGALAAVVDPAGDEDPHVRRRDGLLLTTSLHGLVDAVTAHPGVAWPPLDELVAGLVGAFSRQPVEEVTARLADASRAPSPGPAPGSSPQPSEPSR